MSDATKRVATDQTLQAINTALGLLSKDQTLQVINTALGLLGKDATLATLAKDATLGNTNTALGLLGKDATLATLAKDATLGDTNTALGLLAKDATAATLAKDQTLLATNQALALLATDATLQALTEALVGVLASVKSVNGKYGVVVLDSGDILISKTAQNSKTISEVLTELAAAVAATPLTFTTSQISGSSTDYLLTVTQGTPS